MGTRSKIQDGRKRDNRDAGAMIQSAENLLKVL